MGAATWGAAPCGPASLDMSGVVGVRPMTPDDVAAVAAIEAVSFSDPWPASAFAQLLPQPHVRMHIARGDGEGVLGYCVLLLAADEGEIANIATAPQVRGQGIAGRLLDHALEVAMTDGAAAVFLEVRESNTAARQLYASRGFLPVGRRRGYYEQPREDALLLRRASAGA